MRIIIIGCGQVGSTLTKQLSAENHDIMVIDLCEQRVRALAEECDVMGLCGNGVQLSTLHEAGIDDADILIAVTESDEINLLCCTMAKKVGNCYTVARVRNPVYSGETDFLKAQLGITMIINPELAAALEISQLVKYPAAEQIDSFAGGKMHLVKIKVRAGSPLTDTALRDISVKTDCDILVCAIERRDDVLIPDGNTVILEGDTLSFFASDEKILDVFKHLGLNCRTAKNAMIVGGDTTAYYLAHALLRSGIEVKLIEENAERCDKLCELLPRANIINGDGTDKKLLTEEGVAACDAFVAITNIDEENIFLSMFAKGTSDAKLVAKVDRLEFDEIINGLDIGSIIYPKYITADYIMQFVRAKQNSAGSNISTLYRILDNKVEALEFKVKESSPVIGKPIMDLSLKSGILICSIFRDDKVIIPGGNDMIEKDDSVIIVTLRNGLHDIRDILEG